MYDYVDFEKVEGIDSGMDLKLFALTTCGFCKKAAAFLEEKNVAYSYVYVDTVDPEVKQRIKDDFLKKFKKKMLFPSLIVNDSDFLPGFIRLHWEKLLNEKVENR